MKDNKDNKNKDNNDTNVIDDEVVSYLLPHDAKVLFNLVDSSTIAHLVV